MFSVFLWIYEEFDWVTLADRRMFKRVLQIHKIIDGKTPSYLKYKLPPNRLPFLSNVFREKDLPTRDGLKKHLLFRPKSKSISSLYDPDNLRTLFQLRLGLSPLRSHKEQHNFIDTPSDICLCKHGVEDTHHFNNFLPFLLLGQPW